MDFTPENDFKTWCLLLILTIDDGNKCESMMRDLLRILKYYIDNHKLMDEISEFSDEFINNTISDILCHILLKEFDEFEDNSSILDFLVNISKLLIIGLSKDYTELIKSINFLFNYDDPFFATKSNYSANYSNSNSNSSKGKGKSNQSLISNQYKKFCKDFFESGGLDPLLNRFSINSRTNNVLTEPKLYHFFHFFRIISLTRITLRMDEMSFFTKEIKTSLISFIENEELFSVKENLRNIDSNELFFVLSCATSCTKAEIDVSRFDDLLKSCLFFSLKCLKCDILDKQIIGAKLLNNISEKLFQYNDGEIILNKFIEETSFYNYITEKNFHENVLSLLVPIFEMFVQIVPPKFENYERLYNSIQHSHFTTKNHLVDILIVALINVEPDNNNYIDCNNSSDTCNKNDNSNERSENASFKNNKLLDNFIFNFLLKIEQNELTIEIIEHLIMILPKEYTNYSVKLLNHLLLLITNDDKNEELKEMALDSIQKISQSVTNNHLRNLIMKYCQNILIFSSQKKVPTDVILILQSLMEGNGQKNSSSNKIDVNLVDILIASLESNKAARISIFELLATCFTGNQSTPIRMNTNQLSVILNLSNSDKDSCEGEEEEDDDDEYVCDDFMKEYKWEFLSTLFDHKNTDFLDSDSLSFLFNYLSEKSDYEGCTPSFVVFLLDFIIAVGVSQKKIEKKVQTKNIPKYKIREAQLEGIEFLCHALCEPNEESTAKKAIDAFLFLIDICTNSLVQRKMIEIMLTFLLNPLYLNYRVFVLFVKIIMKFEEGVGIEEYDIERHIPFKTDSYINITVNKDLLKLKVNPLMYVKSLTQKVAFHLKSKASSVCLQMDDFPLLDSCQLLYLDVKEGSDLQVDKMYLVPFNDYSIDNIPTIIFMKHNLINISLKFLRESDSIIQNRLPYKKPIWQFLKLMPSLKVDNRDELIKLIKNAVDDYEMLYLLEIAIKQSFQECDQIGYDQWNLDFAEIVLDLLINQDKIHKKAISPAFTIISRSTIDVSLYSSKLLSIVYSNLKTNTSIEPSIQLLKKICLKENKKTTDFLLEMNYFEIHSDVLYQLNSVFELIEEKSSLFSNLLNYIPNLENDQFCFTLFSLLTTLISPDCENEKALNLCFDLLLSEKMKSNLSNKYFTSRDKMENCDMTLSGACIFISQVLEKIPLLINKFSDIITSVFVPHFLRTESKATQQLLSSILTKVLPTNQKEVVQLTKDHFRIVPEQWNYNPSKNIKFMEQMTGLRNLGATCYLNSIIQQLYANSEFRSKFSRASFENVTHMNINPNLLKSFKELQKLFCKMQLTDAPFLDTRGFCGSFVFLDNQQINVCEQQDAIEFFQFLLDKLRPFAPDLNEMYEGQIINIIEGINDDFQTVNYESFYNLCLTVKNFDNFEESFDTFLKEEIFSGENQYFAESLGKKIDAKKYSRINKLPNNLVIQLKRFEYDLEKFQKYKIYNRFEFPFEFDISKYTYKANNKQGNTYDDFNGQEEEEQIYKLNGIVIHDGIADAGHYYSLVLVNGEWFCFDDNKVFQYPEYFFNRFVYGQKQNASAYLLFYTKKENDNPYYINNFIRNDQEEIEIKKEIEINKESENNKEKELCLLCSSSVYNEINKENGMHNHLQSCFTETVLNFMENIDDSEALTLYLMNVIFHSHLAATNLTKNFCVYLESCIIDSTDFITVISENVDSFYEILMNCSAKEGLSYFVSTICLHISKCEISHCIPLIKSAFVNLTNESILSFRSISLISSMIFTFLSNSEGMEFGLQNHFHLLILNFIYQIIEKNRTSEFWKKVDLHYLFDSLILLHKVVETKMLVNLMNNCNNFMINNDHSKSFVNLFLICFDFNLFISHIFRLFDSKTISRVVIETFCCCIDEEDIKNMMAIILSQNKVSKSSIALFFYEEVKDLNFNFIRSMIKYPKTLIFEFLISDDDISKLYIEKVVYSIFPNISNIHNQDILSKTTESFVFKGLKIAPINIPIDLIGEYNFEIFISTFIEFLYSIDETEFGRSRLTTVIRIIRWALCYFIENKNSSDTYINLMNDLLTLVEKLVENILGKNIENDGNVYELLLTNLYLPDIDINNDIFNKTFPISFKKKYAFSTNIFLTAFNILLKKNMFCDFICNDVNNDFQSSFLDFIKRADSFAIEKFCGIVIEQNKAKNYYENIDGKRFNMLLLKMIEPHLHQMIIDNVFPVVEIVFSLDIVLQDDLFDDLFSFFIVNIEMNFEKKADPSEISFLISICLPQLEKVNNIAIDMITQHIPMFLELYSSLILIENKEAVVLLRRNIRHLFDILCKKNEDIRVILIETMTMLNELDFDLISFFLRIICDEPNDDTFSYNYHYLIKEMLKCMRNSSEDCEECFEELMRIIRNRKIKISKFLFEVSKFLLTFKNWKENTTDFFLATLDESDEIEVVDLISILNILLQQNYVEEALGRAILIVEHKPSITDIVIKHLKINDDIMKLWPDACLKYLSALKNILH